MDDTNRTNLKPEILGVSHIVVATTNIEGTQHALINGGHTKKGSIQSGVNPIQKTPFVFNSLSSTFDMALMSGPTGFPTIELLHENTQTYSWPKESDPIFEIIQVDQLEPDLICTLKCFWDKDLNQLDGIRLPANVSQYQLGVTALIIHCSQIDASLALWKTLGYRPCGNEIGATEIAISGPLPANKLRLYFVPDRASSAKGYLDKPGVVCLSLLCKNSDRLRSFLNTEGFEVGDCFNFNPFGQDFRMFFARSENGEIYEFISLN